MDFLDPKKERRNHLTLLVGYCLVALAISIATLVLLYQSYGYTIDRQGALQQNGLVFVSSQPTNAAIYLNSTRYKNNTDSRVTVPSGSYNLRISAAGYRDWQRQVRVGGGDVQHYDYPLLFPSTLQTTSLADTTSLPSFSTQSPDRRWLLTAQSETSGVFSLYDLKTAAKPVVTTITLPGASFTAGTGVQTWSLGEWASDNTHVLLLHTYEANGTTNREYVLVSRDTVTDTANLTTELKLNQAETLTLFNNRIQQYFVYNPADQTLARINRSDGAVVSTLSHVLSYKTYADNKVLYVADQPPTGKATAGLVSVVLLDGQKSLTLLTLPAGAPSYTLNLAQYSGDWYVAVGASSDKVVYVYKNPQTALADVVDSFPAPWRRLQIAGANYLEFSNNTQYLLAESGQEFFVYDFENIAQYHYKTAQVLDAPQIHATWMDGNRLMYVSGGKLVVFDYDHMSSQTLMTASPTAPAYFAPNYSYVYALRSEAAGAKPGLSSTTLVVKP